MVEGASIEWGDKSEPTGLGTGGGKRQKRMCGRVARKNKHTEQWNIRTCDASATQKRDKVGTKQKREDTRIQQGARVRKAKMSKSKVRRKETVIRRDGGHEAGGRKARAQKS